MAALQARAVAAVVRLTKHKRVCISIIIPTLNEAERLKATLTHLFDAFDPDQTEIIVSDGGSNDMSQDIAGNFPCVVIKGSPGRALQMNRAASRARGEWILFLHADTELPGNWQESIPASRQWGFFPVRLSGRHLLFRVIERAMSLRSSITRVATGDQAMFFRKSFFQQINGFDEIPIMEDIAISKKARRISQPNIASAAIITSSRRWEKNGIIKTIFLMWWMRLAYWSGTSPARLNRIYYPDY